MVNSRTVLSLAVDPVHERSYPWPFHLRAVLPLAVPMCERSYPWPILFASGPAPGRCYLRTARVLAGPTPGRSCSRTLLPIVHPVRDPTCARKKKRLRPAAIPLPLLHLHSARPCHKMSPVTRITTLTLHVHATNCHQSLK
jgi:hypothetical protein